MVFEPRRQATLSALVEGQIAEIAREEGESFEEGEVLVRIDDRAYRATVLLLEARLEAARASRAATEAGAKIDVDEKRIERARAVLAGTEATLVAKEGLARTGSLSTVELEEAKTAAAVARAELELLERERESHRIETAHAVEAARIEVQIEEARLLEARAHLEDCVLKAPFAGRVEKVHAHRLEVSTTGRQLLDLLDDRTLLARCIVPIAHLDSLKMGRRARIRVLEVGSPVDGRLVQIGARVEAVSSTIGIAFEVANPDGALRVGMRGTIDLGELAGQEGD